MAIAQDLLHCVLSGRVMTIIEQKVEAPISERHIGLVEDGGAIYTPPNIQPNVDVVMCWDSTDINEETLSDHGTTTQHK